jgi:cytochrome P450
MLRIILSLSQMHGVLSCVLLLILYLLYNRYGRGLHHFNGPFLASISSGWRVWDVWKNSGQKPYLHLHQRYGCVVRIAPNKLSFNELAAVKDIYGSNGLLQKSKMHLVAQQTSQGQSFQTLFATTDAEWHNMLRRKINSAFSMTTMVAYESYVDETVNVLLEQLATRFANKSGPTSSLDLPSWMHFYTEDAVTSVTYGKRMGVLENGDGLGLLRATNELLLYTIYIMQWPMLDLLLRKNVIKMWLNRHGWFNRQASETVPFALSAQQQRRELRERAKLNQKKPTAETLTDKLLVAQEEYPESIGPRELLSLGLSIIAAGSETTAITLSALFYYLLKNSDCYTKLQAEIDAHFPSTEPITFKQSQNLPYLSAVLKETFRMHPASAWAPERVVPQCGHIIAGNRIPAGTVVSVSAWVIHYDPSIFGEDVDSFRPERWLAEDDIEAAQVREMERSLLQFGVGAYTCIGRNIALMEIYRVVPALMRKFDITLTYPDREWRFLPGSFVNVTDFEVRLKVRE